MSHVRIVSPRPFFLSLSPLLLVAYLSPLGGICRLWAGDFVGMAGSQNPVLTSWKTQATMTGPPLCALNTRQSANFPLVPSSV